jgi:DNA-binding MarR family transcriptional regulator
METGMETPLKLGRLLFLVSRAHHNLASQVFMQIGLHRGQPPVLFELGHQDGITQSELADKLEITRATMTNLLNRMESSGLITRSQDQSDSRYSRIYLTDHGRSTLNKARDLAGKMDATAFAGFSLEEQTKMKSFLDRIHQNLTT